MRRTVGVLLAAAMALPVGLIASPADATGVNGFCAGETGSLTFSPPIPISGPVAVTERATMQLTNCTNLGDITSGTATYVGHANVPLDCNNWDSNTHPPTPTYTGTEVFTWNTGETTTVPITSNSNNEVAPMIPGGDETVTSGLFAGMQFFDQVHYIQDQDCTTTPLSSLTFDKTFAGVSFAGSPGSVICANPQSCNSAAAASATLTAPGLKVNVSGTPAFGAGTATLTIASGSLPCPKLTKTVAPVATLADTGFAPTDRLNVTATLPLASSTSAEQVCFNSNVPFKSQSSPTVKKAGTAFLLNCSQVANAAPCVTSSKQVGSNVVVTFVVPGGDPRFDIVVPIGRQLWLSHFAAGKTGKAFVAQLQSSGGLSPVSWKIASGKSPAGCALNTKNGAITGKPTTKGAYPVVVQATDSERPPQTATIAVPISIS